MTTGMTQCDRCGSVFDAGIYGGTCPRCQHSLGPPQATVEVRPPSQGSVGGAIAGHEVSDLLGCGGMATVHRARQMALDRDLAMKIARDESFDAGLAERFVREAKVLARLEHPNIVPIHELGMNNKGQFFYTMKLVKGRTLQEILTDLSKRVPATMGEYTLERLLTIFHKVGDAVAFAHSQGIIHRDLKPENIMVGEFGEVLVMDWGLAKHLEAKEEESLVSHSKSDASYASFAKTLDGSVIGTPQFMSPEQAQGRVAELDERSDVFSLGGVLYAILTLHAPVEGKTIDEILEKVREGLIAPPSVYGASSSSSRSRPRPQGEILPASMLAPLPHCRGGRVPSALSAVTMKVLATKKEDRYQTVGALLTDLEAYQGGFATRAEEPGTWKHLTLWVRRHRTGAIAIALSLVLIASFTVDAVLEGREPLRGLPIRSPFASGWRGADLAPLTGMKLEVMTMHDPWITSVRVLAGAPLRSLDVTNTSLESLEGLERAPLAELRIRNTQVKSLAPVRACPLRILDAARTPLHDLSPLAGKSLEELNLASTRVTDLSPLQGQPLRKLSLTGTPVTDFGALASLKLRVLDPHLLRRNRQIILARQQGRRRGEPGAVDVIDAN